MVLSVISDSILETARKLNKRDALLAEGEDKENVPADDEYWKDTPGAEGHRGVEGQLKSEGGSYYSYGPYPRNRRILADVALCAGWDVKKIKGLESRIVKAAAKQYKGCEAVKPETMSDWKFEGTQAPYKNGKPFTFQHIAWDRLRHFIDKEVKEMDPDKRAAVKAGVLDMYESNSKTGKKKLPPRGTKRKASNTDGPDAEQVAAAQAEIDRDERYTKALLSEFNPGFRSPTWVRKHLDHLVEKGEFTLTDLCEKLDVSKEDYEKFKAAKKKREQYESKVYHAGVELLERAPGIGKTEKARPAKTRRR